MLAKLKAAGADWVQIDEPALVLDLSDEARAAFGTAYAEQTVLNAGYAYQQAAGIRVKPSFSPTVDAGSPLEGAR